MDRLKKPGKNSVQKKNGTPYEDGELPLKKLPGKKKDKNWKNHLLDKDEDDIIDLSSLEDFKGFEDSPSEDEDDL
ncbi:MAG TPA: hypothetical protein VJY62_08675 [Bacteroidia bacterium]|nr:hypothetical protein [Bacteroidia bacterium]